ncbi:MAG: Xaa-Pro peptidase family protein [Planctomycetota bacterium]
MAAAAITTIPTKEYAARRRKLSTALKKGIALIHAGDPNTNGLNGSYRAHAHFEYLTGIGDEPGAILLLDPGNDDPKRRECLFMKPLDPEMERWDGFRAPIDDALRERTGLSSIFRLYALPRFLTEAALRSRSLMCVHPFASFQQPVSPDLAKFRKVAERIPGVSIGDCTEAMARLRGAKSANEVALIQQAVDITMLGYEEVLRTLRPKMNEFDVQETLEHAYKSHGSRGTGYNSIAGSGVNSTVLHYHANSAELCDGDLICIDSAATFNGYCADITRTLPVNGKFTPRQKEIYELVLKAEEAAIRAVKPGVTLADLDAVARKVITKAGYGDAFYHSIGHHLGMEVHDIAPRQPLKEGAVVTIEPGVYLRDEKIGVRIEDDIVVTKSGYRNLSKKIPKTVKDIERLMAAGRK